MNSALGMNVISAMAAVVGGILSYVDLDYLELTPCKDARSDECLIASENMVSVSI